MQDKVYALVAYVFVEPDAELKVSHIQERHNFINIEPRNVICYGKLAITGHECALPSIMIIKKILWNALLE